MLVAEFGVRNGAIVCTAGEGSVEGVNGEEARPLPAPVTGTGWAPAAEAIALRDGRIELALPGWFTRTGSLCVELLVLVQHGDAAVVTWKGADATLDLAAPAASVAGLSVPLPREAPVSQALPFAPVAGRWAAVSVHRADDLLVLAVDGTVVMRRLADEVFTGFGSAGPVILTGSMLLAGVRVGADAPAHLASAMVAAARAGVGDIGSRWLAHRDALGAPSGPPVDVVGGVVQRCEHGVVARRAAGPACVLLDERIIAAWDGAGGAGALGPGFPTHDEADDDGQPGPDVPRLPSYRCARFERGAIYRALSQPPILLRETFAAAYWHRGGARGLLGFPTAPESGFPPSAVRAVRFELGSIYSWGRSPHETRAVLGAIDDAYLTAGGPGGFLMQPLEEEKGEGPARVQDFGGGSVYAAPGKAGVALEREWVRVYRSTWHGAGGPLGPPASAVAERDGVRFCETEKGILAQRKGRQPVGLDAIELVLGDIVVGAIDDGLDSTAELFCAVTVEIDGERVEDRRRQPPSGYVDGRLQFDKIPYRIERARAGSRIVLKIDVYDDDRAFNGGDDPLGHHSDEFTLANVFGADTEPGTTFISNPYKEVYNDPTRVELNYSCGAPNRPSDPSKPWRSQHWWPIENFSSPWLSRALFDKTFDDVRRKGTWFGTVLHPLDALLYEAVYARIADEGNCYGMALLAATGLHRPDLIRQPLNETARVYSNGSPFVASEERHIPERLRSMINMWQGSQLSSAVVKWTLDQVLNPVLGAADAMAFARAAVARDRPVIVSVVQEGVGEDGHTLVAYERCPDNQPSGVYVADPNSAWPPYAAPSRPEHDTEVRMTDDGWVVRSTSHQGFFDPYEDQWLLVMPPGLGAPPWRTPLPEIGNKLDSMISTLVTFGGAAELEGLVVDGHLVTGKVDGPLQAWAAANGESDLPFHHEVPPPGFAMLPLYDAATSARLGAARGFVPDGFRLQVRAQQLDDYQVLIRTPTAALHWKAYAGDGVVDEIAISGLRAGRPWVRAAASQQKRCELHLGTFGPRGAEVVRMAGDMAAGIPIMAARAQHAAGWDFAVEGETRGFEVAFGRDLDALVGYELPTVAPGTRIRVDPHVRRGRERLVGLFNAPAQGAGLFATDRIMPV